MSKRHFVQIFHSTLKFLKYQISKETLKKLNDIKTSYNKSFKYLIGKKKVGVKKSRQKIWSVKNLVTCPKISHFLPTFFLPIR